MLQTHFGMRFAVKLLAGATEPLPRLVGGVMPQLGRDGSGSTPEKHAAQIRSDLARWARIAKAANLKID